MAAFLPLAYDFSENLWLVGLVWSLESSALVDFFLLRNFLGFVHSCGCAWSDQWDSRILDLNSVLGSHAHSENGVHLIPYSFWNGELIQCSFLVRFCLCIKPRFADHFCFNGMCEDRMEHAPPMMKGITSGARCVNCAKILLTQPSLSVGCKTYFDIWCCCCWYHLSLYLRMCLFGFVASNSEKHLPE